MKYLFTLIALFLFSSVANASDDPKLLIREINRKFAQVNDYSANVDMKFNVPGVRMSNMNGKVFFKRPNKFRIKAKGIFFLPKQNPIQNISTLLQDTASYTSIISGYENINGKNCAIVNIIPLIANGELIIGKFWVDTKAYLILKSQVTTKNNGTLETLNTYGANAKYALPEKITLVFEMKKMKITKMMSVDLNKKSKDKSKEEQKESGSIELNFKDYKINAKIDDAVFSEKES